jgi:p-aminobenzoyl-glutamate transporter AbgT
MISKLVKFVASFQETCPFYDDACFTKRHEAIQTQLFVIAVIVVIVIVGLVILANKINPNLTTTREITEEERERKLEAKRKRDEKFDRIAYRNSTDLYYDQKNVYGAAYHEHSDGTREYKDGDGRPWWL